MNSNRPHNQTSFYKYLTAATGQVVLSNCSLRWSEPSLFNDCFDVPRGILQGFDGPELTSAAVDRVNHLIENPQLAEGKPLSAAVQIIVGLARAADKGFRDRIIESNNLSKNDPRSYGEYFHEMQEQWEIMYPDQRILCLAEECDSASMWDRYSDGNRGVVLEFACLDELDSAWLAAKPVRYTNDELVCNTVEGLAELMLYCPSYAVRKVIQECTHTKTTDWAYEKEWRIASWKRPYEEGAYSDWGFHPQELKSVILGTNISVEDKNRILEVIKSSYPTTIVKQARIKGGRKFQIELM